MFTSINTFLGSLASTKKDRGGTRRGQLRRQRRLLFESLEDRRVLSSVDFGWAGAMGGTGPDYGYDIAVDGAGNVYTTGSFQGMVDFDPGPGTFHLSSNGDLDIFVSKLDSSGNFVWARAMGGTSADEGRGIAVDGAGNVYTTGYFNGTADFDPGAGTFHLTSSGGNDIFVSKLDSSGNFVWARAMGGTDHDAGSGIAVDGGGNVYSSGGFQGTVDFDPGPGTFHLTSSGLSDIFVSKLDSGGNFIWASGMGGTSDDYGSGIAVDGAGNVYTIGYFQDTVDFDSGAGTFQLTSSGRHDIFVSKLDSAGSFVWAKAMGGTTNDYGRDIAVDGAGNVYTTGLFQGTADFDPGLGTFHLTSNGGFDIFVSKLDSGGNFVWARAMGGTDHDAGLGIAVDGGGNVYSSGGFQGTVDFDPGAGTYNLTSSGDVDVFVSKLTQLSPDTTRIGIQVVAVATPSTSGSTVLPSGLETVPLGSTYYVEVWVQDQSVPGVGVAGGWVDVNYTTAVADAVEVFNLDFDVEGLEGGEIDEADGVVRDLGGGTTDGGVGVAEQWARLAYIEFLAAELGEATFGLTPGSFQFALFDQGNVPWDLVDLGTSVMVDHIGATRIDMTVVEQPSDTDAKGEVAVLPSSEDWVHEWQSF